MEDLKTFSQNYSSKKRFVQNKHFPKPKASKVSVTFCQYSFEIPCVWILKLDNKGSFDLSLTFIYVQAHTRVKFLKGLDFTIQKLGTKLRMLQI